VRFTVFLKRGRRILLLLFGILLFLFPFTSGEIVTGLDVPNSPPFLIKDIPNQSWPANQSNLNAFDLDDYFGDPEGNPLSFYNSSVPDINVFINSTTHEVSFFPRVFFWGTRNVTFYASDSVYDTLSNVVMLFVGLDTTPPQWSSPLKDKSLVYQNDFVTFFTNWTDDRALKRYIFSINQGVGWENYSSVNFSGTENFSSHRIQIMAPALNTIYWRFYAFDTSENMNATDIQSFLVSSQQIPPEEAPERNRSTIRETLGGIKVLQQRKIEDFQLSPPDFKVTLKQGSFKTGVLKITNTGLQNLSLSVSSEKIKDFIIFSEENFSLLPGKSKEITIDFNAPERTIPGQYFGHITVKSQHIKKSIPVVLDVQGINLEFDLILNLSEGYELVKPGKNVKVNITIFNIRDLKEVNASMYYAIKDYTGKVYNFSEEQVNFFSTLILERELQVPEISPEGKYLFYARLSDDKNIAIDSVSFEVGNRFNFSSFFKVGSILILVIIFAILLATFMVKYKKDKKKERLLELYIMLNKLKNLIKQNKEEEALKLFIKIKDIYHEPVSKEVFDDKERLKKEIATLYNNFTKDSKEIIKDKESSSTDKPPLKKEQPIKENESKKIVTSTNSEVQDNKKGLKDIIPKEKGEK
jgi:hypothetical protein